MFHTFMAHKSSAVYHTCLQLDVSGCGLVISASFAAVTYCIFRDDDLARLGYMVMFTSFLALGIVASVHPYLISSEGERYRTCILVLQALFSFIPWIHALALRGNICNTLSGITGFVMAAVYFMIGLVFFVFKIPERLVLLIPLPFCIES